MIEEAQELIDFGDSKERAEGNGMMKVINEVISILNNDEYSDGQALDLIYDKLNF